MSLCVSIIDVIPTNKSVGMLAVCNQKYLHIPTRRFADDLEDGKGTYCKTVGQTKEDILDEISSRLRMILIPLKKQGMGWAHVAESILRDSNMAVKGGRLWHRCAAANSI